MKSVGHHTSFCIGIFPFTNFYPLKNPIPLSQKKQKLTFYSKLGSMERRTVSPSVMMFAFNQAGQLTKQISSARNIWLWSPSRQDLLLYLILPHP